MRVRRRPAAARGCRRTRRRGDGNTGAGGRQRHGAAVTYTANLEVDHKALRAQVFNEGWRIMKHRFYDAKMHGANWDEFKKIYAPLLDYLVDPEELHTVMMMMIGQLNASHTGVSGTVPPPASERRKPATPASTSSPTRRASTRSGASTRTAPPTRTT